jgi:prepilin-type N-terminal cleavage/methylation domain-containing protein
VSSASCGAASSLGNPPSGGFTLIEIIMAMAVIGIAAVAFLNSAHSLFPSSLTPASVTRASHLAQARMELLLGRREQAGFGFNTDPCTASPSAASCAGIAGFTVTVSGVNPAVPWPAVPVVTRFRLITVTVTNSSGTTLAQDTAVVANY